MTENGSLLMDINDPQQELFTHIKLSLETLGFDVYDGLLPPAGTDYPFVYLGDMRQSDGATKGAVIGTVYQTIHVWSNTPRNRGTVSKMLLQIKTACRQIERTTHFGWLLLNADEQIITDTTTKTPLLHGVLELGWKFS